MRPLGFPARQGRFHDHSNSSGADRNIRASRGLPGHDRCARVPGIHFRAADVQGAWLGKKVAAWVDKHYFQPVS